MALRRTREFFLLAWGLFSSIAGGLWVTTSTAQHWGAKAGRPADLPAVESASQDVSDTYNLPMDLSDEPYVLAEWDPDMTLRRPGWRYTFPPGIILVGTLAAVALMLLLGKNYKRFPFAPKESGNSDDSTDEASLESSAHLEDDAVLELQQTLDSTLNRVSSELDRVANEKEEKKSAAMTGAREMPKEVAAPTNDVIALLSNVSDQLIAPANALSHAVAAMLGPLSDSQSLAHLDAAREQLQAEIQIIKNFDLQGQLEAAATQLEEMADTEEQGGWPLHDQVTKCREWLEALREQHRTILSSAATVSSVAEELSAFLESRQL